MEELGEPLGTKPVLQPTCSETSLQVVGRELTVPSLLASSKPCRSSAGLRSGAAAPLPINLQFFSPDRVTKRGRAGSTAGADPSAMQ